MFLLVPAHPGFPGQIPQSRKTVVCCVLCVCVLRYASLALVVDVIFSHRSCGASYVFLKVIEHDKQAKSAVYECLVFKCVNV